MCMLAYYKKEVMRCKDIRVYRSVTCVDSIAGYRLFIIIGTSQRLTYANN